jgi:hypothetical protein
LNLPDEVYSIKGNNGNKADGFSHKSGIDLIKKYKRIKEKQGECCPNCFWEGSWRNFPFLQRSKEPKSKSYLFESLPENLLGLNLNLVSIMLCSVKWIIA